MTGTRFRRASPRRGGATESSRIFGFARVDSSDEAPLPTARSRLCPGELFRALEKAAPGRLPYFYGAAFKPFQQEASTSAPRLLYDEPYVAFTG
jgi:hypothetical protein